MQWGSGPVIGFGAFNRMTSQDATKKGAKNLPNHITGAETNL